MKAKKVTEKATGEKYASKKAMVKHEKGESKTMQKKEIKKGTPLHQVSGAIGAIKSAVKTVVKAATTPKPTSAPVKGKPMAPTKMKKC